ncbi:hypothetical protein [Actinomadura fibrosa]|uniref:IPT/TIG domain-containing protein n=1 Tax=Actinomadura fibrosa TaxID=111802 RepID=A0ABW2XCW1_9ACTN|nr:hypothetical protein [Actinomadura fibrosa]
MPNSSAPRRSAAVTVAGAAALAGALALGARPAHAASLRVSPASGVNPSGQTVSVRGSGFDPARNNGFGVYVVFGPRGADWTTNANAYLSAVWVHRGAAAGAGQAPMSGAGGFSVTLSVKAKYTDGDGRKVDCLRTQCYVMTMAAHGVPDRGQDTVTPIRFQGAGSGQGSSGSSGGSRGGTGSGGGAASGGGSSAGAASGGAASGGTASTPGATASPAGSASPGAGGAADASPAAAFEQTVSGGRAGSPWPFWAVTGAALLAVPAARYGVRRRTARRRSS